MSSLTQAVELNFVFVIGVAAMAAPDQSKRTYHPISITDEIYLAARLEALFNPS